MQRNVQTFPINSPDSFIRKALSWSDQFNHFSYFNPNDYKVIHGPFPHLMGAGALNSYSFDNQTFKRLKEIYDVNSWLMGYFSYDLKNEIEALSSKNPSHINVAPAYFFEPEHLLFFDNDKVSIHTHSNPVGLYEEICEIKVTGSSFNKIDLDVNISKSEYLGIMDKIRNHIVNGDIYEINYCIEFSAWGAIIDPLIIFMQLMDWSPMPFSSLQKINRQYLISASPERFLKKTGQKLISQPMKGTIRRGKSKEEDLELKTNLYKSKKERAENMMIVDLVRNDLAKSAVPGTVTVEELFGISTFPGIHQMISTITAEIKPEVHPIEAIKNAFPMGSMTGAPKIRAMELIEHYEKSKRGWYSGAAGFFSPGGDFDFNVVIRSLIYDSINNKLSYHAGSAITCDSIPEKEYEECILKVQNLMHLFSINK